MNIDFPTNYPSKPPIVFFKTKIFHPNFREDKKVCCCSLEILGSQWFSNLSISNVVLGICSLLTEPYPNSECKDRNKEATYLYKYDRTKFEETAKEWTKKYACY